MRNRFLDSVLAGAAVFGFSVLVIAQQPATGRSSRQEMGSAPQKEGET